MLSSFLISQDFSKGFVDPTLFIRREGKELLLVQIYIDDIIFAASTPELCDQFAKIMCSKFKMSMMGKISFFLGLRISQSPRGIFINQSKYALESLKKLLFELVPQWITPIVKNPNWDEDKEGKAVDSHIIGTVIGLCYPNDLQFALTAFADADHAGCQETYQAYRHQISLYQGALLKWGWSNFTFVQYGVSTGDIFTKALGRERIEFLINKLGMRSFTP
ncbi:retrovirus-related pol polyprotein from transposon TNT 1-94 [Tanacetum coccineum]